MFFFVKSKIIHRQSLGFLILLSGTTSFDYDISIFIRALFMTFYPTSRLPTPPPSLVKNSFCQPWCNKTLFSVTFRSCYCSVMLLSCYCTVIIINSHFSVKCVVTSKNSNILEDSREVLNNMLEKIKTNITGWGKIITSHFYIILQNIDISWSFDISLSVLCSILLKKMILWTIEHCPKLQIPFYYLLFCKYFQFFYDAFFFLVFSFTEQIWQLPWIIVVVFYIYWEIIKKRFYIFFVRIGWFLIEKCCSLHIEDAQETGKTTLFRKETLEKCKFILPLRKNTI